MILHSLCNSCMQPFTVILETGDAELIRQISLEDNGLTCKCPRLCGGRINLVGNPVIQDMTAKLREPMTITGKELYVAVHGLGLPDEVCKDPEVIKALLKSNKVSDLYLEQVGDRVYLHEVRLENGFTLHLAAGARGALVLKVTKEKKPCP